MAFCMCCDAVMDEKLANMEKEKMNHKLFEDELICLANIEPDKDAEIESKRKALHRDGNYWDVIFMGVLREEWEIHR